MTRSTIVASTIAFAILVIAMPNLTAAQGVYVGPAYSSHVEDLGIAGGVYFPITVMIQGGGDFTYYFVSEDGDSNLKIWTVDLNGRYPLVAGENGGPAVFAIAGVNVLRWSFDAPESPGFDFSTSGTDVGINAGAVVEFNFNSFGVFGKAHAVGIGGDSSGFVGGAGIFKTLGG